MKGKYTVFFIIAVLFVAIGATFYFVMQFFDNNPTQPQPASYMTGIIMEINDNGSILVIADLPVEEAKKLSVQEAIDAGKDATWFTVTMDQRNKLEVYDKVKIGFTGLKESYPMQGSAKTLEKLTE